MTTYFISHASSDCSFIEAEIIPLLKAFHIDYWYSKEDIQTGEQWEQSIKNGLESCDGFLLVMSSDSAKSEWVKDETHWAFNNRDGRIFPIRYNDCKLEDFHIRLPRIQHADFTKDEKAGRLNLISLIRKVEYATNSRVTAIEGDWYGEGKQKSLGHDGPLIYPIKFKIEVVEGHEVKGLFSAFHPVLGEIEFSIIGGFFFFDRFLQVDYRSKKPEVTSFGSIIMELDPSGNSMSGRFLTFGYLSKKIITGDITAKRR